MRTEQLEYLRAIKKYGNMSKASMNINLSPQALSTSMRLLEKELGFPILIADNKGVQFTAYGNELLDISEHFFADLQNLRQKTELAYISNHVAYNFHMPEPYKNMYFNKIYKQLNEMNNDIEVNIYTHSFTEILQLIKEDKIPYSFFNQQYVDGVNIRPDLDETMIFEELPCAVYYKLICHKNHRFATYKRISLKSVMKEVFIMHTPSAYYMEPIIRYSGQSPTILPAPNVETLVYMAERNKGVFLTPVKTSSNKTVFDLNLNILALVKTKELITEKFGIIRKKDTILTEAHLHEIELVKNILGQ